MHETAAKKIAAKLNADSTIKAHVRVEPFWSTVFVDDALTGASCGAVQVFESGRAKSYVTYFHATVNAAIAA